MHTPRSLSSPPAASRVHRISRRAFLWAASGLLGAATLLPSAPSALAAGGKKMTAVWTTSLQSAFPGGTTGYLLFAFPNAATDGANEQTLRMIVKPDIWAGRMRFKFSNAFGTKPLTFGKVTAGLNTYGGNVLPGSLSTITFNGGQTEVTIPPGQELFSDQITLNFYRGPDDPALEGRKLAVSMHVRGTSGQMSYHGAAFQTNYVTDRVGDRTGDTLDLAFPYRVTSWFFLNEIDAMLPRSTRVLVGFGSSSVDGTNSTLNGNDRFLDDMSRRLHAAYGNHVSVVNAGIGGDTAARPPNLAPTARRTSVLDRVDRDAFSITGMTDMLLYVGTNDYGAYALPASDTIAAYRDLVGQFKARGIRVIGATITSTVNDPSANYGTPFGLAQAAQINDFIRNSGGLFDSLADFERATTDPATGAFYPVFQQHGDFSPPDFLHTGPAGMQAEAETLDLTFFQP